jgi:hypothetical protein
VSTSSFATVDYGKHRTGKTTWRVVQGTGNCCENYLAVTKAGRLLDFGGTYVNYTDDLGLHWKQMQPATPPVNGEGTLDLAPNGDVIAIGWDAYSGDHLQAFKYEAFSGKWWWTEQPLHTPFYDREWVTVVPGPFSIGGATYPYVSFLKGGYPSKELWLYSTDGLTYDNASVKFADDTQNGSKTGPLPTAKLGTADWTQGNSNTGLAALGAGGALASPDEVSDWSLLDPATLTWSGYPPDRFSTRRRSTRRRRPDRCSHVQPSRSSKTRSTDKVAFGASPGHGFFGRGRCSEQAISAVRPCPGSDPGQCPAPTCR